MFPLYPPDDPFLINTQILGFPLVVRWYGVLIVSGALLAGYIASRRASERGYDPEHIWNLLMVGMILGVAGARAYYVAFEWNRFAGRPLLEIINPAGGGGGLAIHGAIIGAILATLIYTGLNKLPTIRFIDIALPTMLVAQAIGRWGNFFNQEAYGRPTSLPFGVVIDADRRLPPYNDMQKYPPNTLFHATFLYESVYDLAGFGVIMWLERRLRNWLRTGDVALMYAIWYGFGRFWVEGLRTDSLCTNGIGGSCAGALRAAQIASVLLFLIGILGIFLNHRFHVFGPAPIPGTPGVQPFGSTIEEDSDESSNEPGAKSTDHLRPNPRT